MLDRCTTKIICILDIFGPSWQPYRSSLVYLDILCQHGKVSGRKHVQTNAVQLTRCEATFFLVMATLKFGDGHGATNERCYALRYFHPQLLFMSRKWHCKQRILGQPTFNIYSLASPAASGSSATHQKKKWPDDAKRPGTTPPKLTQMSYSYSRCGGYVFVEGALQVAFQRRTCEAMKQ